MKSSRVRGVLLPALLVASGLLSSCAQKPVHVLFVGNSLTYVGNLPEVFSAVCTAAGHRCSVEMIAQGGATLHERVIDQSLQRAAQMRRFEYAVLQERGGDYISPMSRDRDRTQAEQAAASLSLEARRLAMKPVILGTYQDHPISSEMLVKAEAALARKLQVPFVPVSNFYLCGKRDLPTLRWLDADGGHPGADLTLLMALLLHRELFGSYPRAVRLRIDAPLYGPMNSPRSSSFASGQKVEAGVRVGVTYERATVRALIQLVETACK